LIKKSHAILLTALAVGMFGFAFALVPLYNVFCEITGLNGKTAAQATLLDEVSSSTAIVNRDVSIEFLAKAERGLPWEFRPLETELVVRPGEMNTTSFYVRNRSAKTITAQAVPSVSPGQAAQYLKKIECFCFEQQELAPGAELEMGLTFFIGTDLPAEIRELTLSYAMFYLSDVDHDQMTSHHQ
jgi:cytochrome c oxidase assembly protein subunit 11